MTQRDGMGREVGGGSGWGARVYPWQIHVDVWQNQYNIVKKKKKGVSRIHVSVIHVGFSQAVSYQSSNKEGDRGGTCPRSQRPSPGGWSGLAVKVLLTRVLGLIHQ